MATKTQMRDELDALTSEYLGFKTTSGLPKSASHALLERRLGVYRRMVELMREYREVRNRYTNEQILAFSVFDGEPKDLEVANTKRRTADFAWSHPDIAAERLRVHGDL